MVKSDPTKDKEFNETMRRALAMPHKPHGGKIDKLPKKKRKTAKRKPKAKTNAKR